MEGLETGKHKQVEVSRGKEKGLEGSLLGQM